MKLFSRFRRASAATSGPASGAPPQDAAGPSADGRLEWTASSRRGLARSRNVDAWAVALDSRYPAFAVADGVGAMPAAGVASRAAADEAVRLLKSSDGTEAHARRLLTGPLRETVLAALDGKPRTGATTLAAAVFLPDCAIVAGVGDSEAIAIWDDGRTELVNPLDHSALNPNMVEAWIDGAFAHEPHLRTLAPAPRALCLVTDGLTRGLTLAEIARLVAIAPSDAARTLVSAAQEAGSGDDVTAVVILRPGPAAPTA
ncbi:MAG: protein phosphatase 2C domain-containing protein [Dehalococcoidia bacterium]